MIKNIKTIAIFALCLVAAPMLIQAEESAAIEIDADQSNCGTDLEDCTLEGNVVIKQGDSNITADKSPVNFNYLVGSESRASGNANNVSFDLNQRMISLDGNAQLIDGKNELNGEHIEYDLNKERLKANNQGNGTGRVHLVFEPPTKKSEPNTQPELSPESN